MAAEGCHRGLYQRTITGEPRVLYLTLRPGIRAVGETSKVLRVRFVSGEPRASLELWTLVSVTWTFLQSSIRGGFLMFSSKWKLAGSGSIRLLGFTMIVVIVSLLPLRQAMAATTWTVTVTYDASGIRYTVSGKGDCPSTPATPIPDP